MVSSRTSPATTESSALMRACAVCCELLPMNTSSVDERAACKTIMVITWSKFVTKLDIKGNKKDTVKKREKKKPNTGIKEKAKVLSSADINGIISVLKGKKDIIVSKSILQTSSEPMWMSDSSYQRCMTALTETPFLKTITECIMEDYISIYLSCNKGKTKYGDFQLEWFQNNAKYLKEAKGDILTQIREIKSNLDSKNNKHFLSCLISILHQAIFDECSRETIDYLRPQETSGSSTNTVECDEEFMLLYMHGWVLKEALQHPYKENTGLTENEKKKWLECCTKLKSDKKELPQQLKYVDVYGKGLTFPSCLLLPFLCKCDLLFKEYSDERKELEFGANLSAVIKMQLKHNTILKRLFEEAVCQANNDNVCDILDKLFTFWIEKFSNVRYSGFLKAREMLAVHNSGKMTTLTQNLRDELYTDHVKNKKSHCK